MRLILVLAAVVLAVIFAAQNADIVSVSLLAWQFEASLAVIIVLCFAFGAIATALALGPRIYRSRSDQRKLNQRIADLEAGMNREEAVSAPHRGTAPAEPLSR